MNSEELELSLRTEFENYLKATLARFRQEVSDIRVNLEAEFDKHKAQIDTALTDMESRFDSGVNFDRAFTESVLEHLRLARDEGAELAATAFGEAEKLKAGGSPSDYDQLRDAINDISRQQTQTAILQSLVSHVSRFAPRGAFFIVKNDYFIGWRAFGAPGTDETSVREVFFPTSAETLLAAAANSLVTRESGFGGHRDDEDFLKPLGFGEPDKMVAVPLTARGRGVAVLYVDGGNENSSFAVKAVESLVRVAGLTVELQASYAPRQQQAAAPAVETQPVEQVEAAAEPQAAESTQEITREDVTPEVENETEAVSTSELVDTVEFEYTGDVAVEEAPLEEPAAADYFGGRSEAQSDVVSEAVVDDGVSYFEPIAEPEPVSDFSFSTDISPAAEQVEAAPEPAVAVESSYAGYETKPANGNGFASIPEAVVDETVPAQPVRTRGRNVELPIEVAENERRIHTEAFAFARLLVSEIKLYNQQKVDDGRNSGDLYDRLREAIDRSREMYEKRVKPEVATRFDYFDYMIVSNLADGNVVKLGSNYPGSAV